MLLSFGKEIIQKLILYSLIGKDVCQVIIARKRIIGSIAGVILRCDTGSKEAGFYFEVTPQGFTKRFLCRLVPF